MRPIVAEHLGVTRSPYTVDAGHFQFETELIDWTQVEYPRGPYSWMVGKYTIDQFSWSPLLRVGLSDRVELQGSVSYLQVFEEFKYFSPGFFGSVKGEVTERADYSYFGHATGALKVNVLGNDGGRFGLALVPFIVVPLEDKREDLGGGLDIPVELKLPADFKLRVNSGVTIYEYDCFLNNSANLSVRVMDKVELYGEFSSTFFATEPERWVGYLGTGASWDITSNFQVQAGINFRVTDKFHAPYWRYDTFDTNPFLRVICRF